MNVLLLSQYFPPEPGSAAAKMAELATYLVQNGHEVRVVSQVPNYPSGLVYPGYEGAWFRRESGANLNISRTWSYATTKRKRFWPRLLNHASFMITALVGMFSGPRPDVTFVYSPPLFLGLTAAVASKIWRRPFVFWVNDLWPQGALWLGFMKEGALYRLACAMERFIYRQAPCILVYSLQRKQELVDKGIDGNKIIHHPLWIDTEVFHPDPKGAAKVRKEYGWGKKFVVLYGGNIGLAQGLDVFVESARLLRDNPEVLFVMVGSGVEKPKLEQLVHNYRLDNIVFVDQQPKEKVGAFFSAADVLFAHLGDAPHRFGTVPEKVLAYMACGRPVLMAAQEGAGSDLVRECRCGMAVPPDNPEAVTQAVLSLLQNRGQLQELGQMGRAAAEAKFAGPKVLKAMEASMAELCSVSR